jgi:anaerobic magnesium-protoporphyrin IX monomethyl ester cyclase
MSRQVLLVVPDSPFLFDSRAVPPLGVLYLGASLEANGFDPKVVDLAKKGATISGFDPCLIGISCVSATYPSMPGIMAECRRVYPGVPVIVGGPHFSIVPDDAEALGADSVGVGDCEDAIVEAAGDASKFGLLAKRYGSPGGVVDLNKYPIPARHLVPIHEYTYELYSLFTTPTIFMRGCSFSCGFCAHWEGFQTMRYRHIENAIEEIRQLKGIGFGSFIFYEDGFNINEPRLLSLCKELESENILFRALARSNIFNLKQADALARAGCRQLSFGVESGSAQILRNVNKKTTPEINAQARKICREAGIPFKAFVIVGLPGETRETAMETKRWLIENQVDDFTISIYMPYLGTPIAKNPELYDIQFQLDYRSHVMAYRSNDLIQKDDLVRTSSLSAAEIAELRDQIDTEVRSELGLHPPLRSMESTSWRKPDRVVSTGPSFSIVHASARPQGWRQSYDSWMVNAANPDDVEYILVADIGGPFSQDGHLVNMPANVRVVWNPRRKCCVDAFNVGAERSTGRVLIGNADDFFAFPGWDEQLLDAIKDMDEECVVEVSTGGIADAARVMTVPIMTRARYQRFGYIFHPAYTSMSCDIEYTEVARRDGIVVDARHLTFKHRHPTTGEAAWDEVYSHQNLPENYAIGDRVLADRRARGFPVQ